MTPVEMLLICDYMCHVHMDMEVVCALFVGMYTVLFCCRRILWLLCMLVYVYIHLYDVCP